MISAHSIPRSDENSLLAHAQLVEKARQGGIDVYFVGDSITRRWGATDYPELLDHWRQCFHGWNAANFGWGGDTVANIRWRLEHGELDGVHPKVIVILAGTNDLGSQPVNDPVIEGVINGIGGLVKLCRAKAPVAKIILTAIFPRNDDMNLLPAIDRINHAIARLGDNRSVVFLNVNDRLADPNGRLFDGTTGDGLHLALKGYQIWADGLKPILRELLGPPAQTDHAPPPTGDPGACGSLP